MSQTGSDTDGQDRDEGAAGAATIQLRNARTGPVWYGLEPWGEGHELRSGSTLTLLSEGLNGEYLEVVLDETSVTTWSDTGSTVTLVEGERELGAGIGPRPPVPHYPPGFGRPRLPLSLSGAHRVELLLHNDDGRALALVVPAQSKQYALPPGAKCAVVVAGMSAGPIELELAEGAVIVHGWPASQIAVLEEEEGR